MLGNVCQLPTEKALFASSDNAVPIILAHDSLKKSLYKLPRKIRKRCGMYCLIDPATTITEICLLRAAYMNPKAFPRAIITIIQVHSIALSIYYSSSLNSQANRVCVVVKLSSGIEYIKATKARNDNLGWVEENVSQITTKKMGAHTFRGSPSPADASSIDPPLIRGSKYGTFCPHCWAFLWTIGFARKKTLREMATRNERVNGCMMVMTYENQRGKFGTSYNGLCSWHRDKRLKGPKTSFLAYWRDDHWPMPSNYPYLEDEKPWKKGYKYETRRFRPANYQIDSRTTKLRELDQFQRISSSKWDSEDWELSENGNWETSARASDLPPKQTAARWIFFSFSTSSRSGFLFMFTRVAE